MSPLCLSKMTLVLEKPVKFVLFWELQANFTFLIWKWLDRINWRWCWVLQDSCDCYFAMCLFFQQRALSLLGIQKSVSNERLVRWLVWPVVLCHALNTRWFLSFHFFFYYHQNIKKMHCIACTLFSTVNRDQGKSGWKFTFAHNSSTPLKPKYSVNDKSAGCLKNHAGVYDKIRYSIGITILNSNYVDQG